MPASLRITMHAGSALIFPSLLFLFLLFLPWTAFAQTSMVAGLAAIPNLDHLTQKAGYIFSGTVTSVSSGPAVTHEHVATVQVTFRVEQAVRGVRTGQTIAIREWAGLWDAAEPYRPGERVMLFLYPRSRLGLTSPVGGSQGRFDINRDGQIVLPLGRASALWPTPSIASRPSSGATISTRTLVQAIRQAERN